MKKILLSVVVATALISCNAPDADKATTNDKLAESAVSGEEYIVDSTSTVEWTGTKPGGSHTGIFPVSNGTLYVQDNSITGGSFEINISGIKNQDLSADPENQAKLEGHLKSPDFFDVEKYPTSNFVITSVSPYQADSTQPVLMQGATHTVTGNLTLKDKTKSVSFPAKLTADNSSATASADFNIDRTDWNLSYKGPGNPQDWVISKTVNVKINLKSSKK